MGQMVVGYLDVLDFLFLFFPSELVGCFIILSSAYILFQLPIRVAQV